MTERHEKKVMNRWIVVVGALLVQLALGAVYSFSIFTTPLSESLDYSSTSFHILGIFAAAIAVFAITVIFAGKAQDKRGPRIVATVGGLVYAAGYLIASVSTDNLAMMYLSYGVIGGIGLGLGYVCPLAAALKWFPDKKGLVGGIAVAGFGAGAFLFTQIGKWLIGSQGLDGGFLYLGLIFLAMVVLGAQLLTNPPAGWLPKGFVPAKNSNGNGKVDYTQREMLRTRSFLFLWVMFALSATAGLMMIGNVKNLAIYLDPTKTASVVAEFQLIAGILALFNGAGRISWGTVSDRIGRTKTLRLMFVAQALVLFTAAVFFWVKPSGELVQFLGLTALASCVGFTFGGNFALFPSITFEFFGPRNMGNNYGYVFTSYGFAGVLGALIPSVLAGSQIGFVYAFIAVGIASLVAFGLAMITHAPTHSETVEAPHGGEVPEKT